MSLTRVQFVQEGEGDLVDQDAPPPSCRTPKRLKEGENVELNAHKFATF